LFIVGSLDFHSIEWILMEIASPPMEKIPWINHFSHTPTKEWFWTSGILHVSPGNLLFFTICCHDDWNEDSKRHLRWLAPWWMDCEDHLSGFALVLMCSLPNFVIGVYGKYS
jgi:hypothetical protein